MKERLVSMFVALIIGLIFGLGFFIWGIFDIKWSIINNVDVVPMSQLVEFSLVIFDVAFVFAFVEISVSDE